MTNNGAYLISTAHLSDNEISKLLENTLELTNLLFGNLKPIVTLKYSRNDPDVPMYIVITDTDIVDPDQIMFFTRYLQVCLRRHVFAYAGPLDDNIMAFDRDSEWTIDDRSPIVRARVPEVKYLSATTNADFVTATAMRTCYSSGEPLDRYTSLVERSNDDQSTDDIVSAAYERCITSGHHSVLEHFNVTFAIGCSRAASHQWVRHRIQSISQQSQRYVDPNRMFEVVIPESIRDHSQSMSIAYLMHMESQIRTYRRMTDEGVAAEDARFVLGNGAYTKLVCTMNARSLMNLFANRCCTRAQWEIRKLATQLLHILQEKHPLLFKHPYMGAKCCRLGYCEEKEDESCGRYPLKKDALVQRRH